jgi:hypothetical protein
VANDKECLDCEKPFTPDDEDQDVCDECFQSFHATPEARFVYWLRQNSLYD